MNKTSACARFDMEMTRARPKVRRFACNE